MHEDELKTFLREHDPAEGKSLSAEDASAMRRRILEAVPGRPRRQLWRPVLAFVVMVGIVITVMILDRPTSVVEPETAAVTQTARDDGDGVQSEPAVSSDVRQIHYTTEGGTRIIWTLDPEFEL